MTPLHPSEAGGFSPRLRSALAPPGPPLAPVEPHPAQIALAFLARLRGAGEALFAAAVLAVVLLLVAPLPAGALDALLAVNLAGSATILVVTLFARSALGFASFPTLLLLTTLFRLALSGTGQLICTLGPDLNVLMVDPATGKEQGKTFLAYNNAAAPALQVFATDRQPIRWWSQKGFLLANVPGSQLPQKSPGQFLAKLDLSQGTVEFLATGLEEGSILVGMQDAEATFVKPGGGLAFLQLK